MNLANNKVNMSTAIDTSVNNGECHSIMPKHPKMVNIPLTKDVMEDDIALYTLSISFVILDNKSPWKWLSNRLTASGSHSSTSSAEGSGGRAAPLMHFSCTGATRC